MKYSLGIFLAMLFFATGAYARHDEAVRGRCVRDRDVPSRVDLRIDGFTVVVFKRSQCFGVYTRGRLAQEGETEIWGEASTGGNGHTTPSTDPFAGPSRIWLTSEHHHSRLYDASMPLALFFSPQDKDVALHYGDVSRPFASHGCVRLPHYAASALFYGTRPESIRVIVLYDDEDLQTNWEGRDFPQLQMPVPPILVDNSAPQAVVRERVARREDTRVFTDPFGVWR